MNNQIPTKKRGAIWAIAGAVMSAASAYLLYLWMTIVLVAVVAGIGTLALDALSTFSNSSAPIISDKLPSPIILIFTGCILAILSIASNYSFLYGISLLVCSFAKRNYQTARLASGILLVAIYAAIPISAAISDFLSPIDQATPIIDSQKNE